MGNTSKYTLRAGHKATIMLRRYRGRALVPSMPESVPWVGQLGQAALGD